MSEKVVKVGVRKEPGYIYFIDTDGDISRAKMNRTGRAKMNRTGRPKRQAVND